MSVKRFFSATSREAIKLVRAELGDEAVILSNREVDGGVEVIASAHDDIAALIDRAPRTIKSPAVSRVDPAALPTVARIAHALQSKQVKQVGATASSAVRGVQARPSKPDAAPGAESFAHFIKRSEDSRKAGPENTAIPAKDAPAVKPDVIGHPSAPPTAVGADPQIMAEIRQMRSILQEQVDVLAWRDTATRRPLQASMISQLLSSGFSPALSRALADKLPADFNNAQGDVWLQDSLIRNIAMSSTEADLVDRGGVYALVGPTGVGKTTTAAKLAARCAMKFGAKSLGLITVDSYRIGAEDQLRAYGKILGVTVHTARDAQSLADLIALLRDKHLVLIDTVGMGQRDVRLVEQMQMLSSPSIERVLFLNASAQAETLDDVVRLYRGQGHKRTTKVIISKLDEAVKYGFVLDCLIRHKLELQYVTNGQRVPEDLHPANARYLVHRALKHRAASAFSLADAEIPLVLPPSSMVQKPVASVIRHV